MAAEAITAKVVDFSNVKDGGGTFNKKRVTAGDYLAKVTKVQDAESKKDGQFQWLFTIALETETGVYPYYCKLVENQLWKLRNLFLAAGIAVPKKKVKVDPSKVVGKLIGVTMEDDEYDGKAQSVIAAVFPASELSDDEDDEDDEGADTEDEEEDAEDEAADDPEDDDEEEDEEPEPAPAPKRRAAAKKTTAKRPAKPAADEDDELEELDLEGL